jgi:hypothetical protein
MHSSPTASDAGSWKEAAVCLLVVWLGCYAPDIDNVLPLLVHRSAVTHSILIPALVAARHRIAGGLLGLSLSVHLTADLFPKAWIGFATIHVPLVGGIGLLSPVWILANVVLCIVLAHRLLGAGPAARGRIYFGIGIFVGAAYFVLNEHKPLLIAAYAAIAVPTLYVSRRLTGLPRDGAADS